jgi:putative membrane protein
VFPQGFLGTRADLLTDVITVGYGVIPLVLYLSALRARRGEYRLHRAVQCACLAALTVILVLFEVNIRLRGGSQALFVSSSFAETPLLRATLLVHLAIAVSTYLAWVGLTVVSWRRFERSLPGAFGATHRIIGKGVIAGNVATAITGVWLYVVGFVL